MNNIREIKIPIRDITIVPAPLDNGGWEPIIQIKTNLPDPYFDEESKYKIEFEISGFSDSKRAIEYIKQHFDIDLESD